MGFSFQELMIVMLIGLIVLGPERLPRIANQLGGWIGKARRMTRVMKRQLEDELNFDKDFEIMPPDRTRHSDPGGYKPAPFTATPAKPDDPPGARQDDEKDDSYSPAHDADSPGLGVDDDPPLDDDADPAETGTEPDVGDATDDDKKNPQR